MNTHALLPIAALLLAGPAQVCAIELGRLDLTAPGAMISTCGGMGQGGSVGDKHGWQPGRFTCNAEMTASPSAVIGQSATYTEGPILVDTYAWGESVMGQTRLYAHSLARQDAGTWPTRTHARKVLLLAGCVQPAMTLAPIPWRWPPVAGWTC